MILVSLFLFVLLYCVWSVCRTRSDSEQEIGGSFCRGLCRKRDSGEYLKFFVAPSRLGLRQATASLRQELKLISLLEVFLGFAFSAFQEI